MRFRIVAGSLIGALLSTSCSRPEAGASGGEEDPVLTERLRRFEQATANPDSTPEDPDAPIALWKLPEQLKEISGLALTADNRLLTHGDEVARIFEIDYRRGVIAKEFTVGAPAVRGDFEAITVLGDTLLLATMAGVIYRFPEGVNGASVPYTVTDTKLGSECEFEAMTADTATNVLLLACKQVFDKAMKDQVIIYRLPLRGDSSAKARPLTPLKIPLATMIGLNGWKAFHPSDISINPLNGNYVIIASIEKALAEITPAGALIYSRPLPKGHDQAEGLAIAGNRILFVGDEAKGSAARITLYRWP